ncbi:MAG TPA: hypothetical protein VGK69_04835 [Gaiellaceae bacterium]
MGATLLASAAFGVFFVAASGAAPSCPTPGNFEIDGDMAQHTCANPQDDWNTAGIGVQSTTQGGTYSTSGKDGDDPSGWTSSGSTPDKTNFAQAYATSRVVGGDFYVFVAWERTSTSGTQGYAIEVDNSGANVGPKNTPQPKRGSGGSVFYISSQGSSAPAFDSACSFSSQSDYGQTCTSSASAAGVTAAINTASMSDPLNNTTQPAGGFFEVALDITTLTGIAPSCPGPAAASVYLRSITGQTSNGNLKGYMAPLNVAPDSTCVPPPIDTTATPGGSSNLPGATQHDEAMVGTQAAPGVGSVKFFLCSPAEVTANKGDCSANGTQVGSAVTLGVDGKASSGNVGGATTSTIGTYCWRVEFTPGPNDHHYLAGSHTNSDSECFTVIKASPSIATTASVTGNGVVGTDSTSDSATVTGGVNPGGTIQFSITDPNGHKTNVGSAVTVTGDGTYDAPSSVKLTLVGTYTWSASYSGDSLNNGAVDNGDNESVTSIKASPSITTKATVTGNGVVGTDSTSDSATVTGGDSPAGTIQFSITDPNGHKTAVGGTVTVNGDGTYNAPSSVSLALVGTYTWSASYSGDSLNNGAVDNGDNESVTTGKASPSISTKASVTGSGVVGTDSTSDSATVTGGVNPGGTIQFSITDSNGHTTNVGSAVTVTGDGTYNAPSSVSLALVGTYTWSASYSGDSLNDGAADNGVNESVTSIPASPSIKTKASMTNKGVVGTDTTSDTATVSGGDDPTGTIQFSITDPNGHKTAVGGPVTVTGDGDYDAPSSVPLTVVGTYTWTATYSGDSLNSGAVDNGANESVTSIKASPSIATHASVTGNGVVGTDSTSDTATISGGDDPTGTIQFSITDPNGHTTDVGSPVQFNGDGTYDAPSSVSLALVGTYTWTASYSGDSLNSGAVDNGGNESVDSIPDSPSINTTPLPSSGSVGDVLQDSAKLSGGFDPTGTITFDLYDNSTCSGTPLDEETVSVSGNGTYTTSTGFTSTKAITYYWVANYGGDTDNNKAAAGCADEPVLIKPATIRIVKTADAPQVNAGEPIGFTMTVFNEGTGDARGVTLSDTLPSKPGLSWKIAANGVGAGWGASGCSIASGVLSCGGANGVTVQGGTTQAASTFTVHVTSTTDASTGGNCPGGNGVVDNTATVNTANSGSDESEAKTCVAAPAVSITKTADHSAPVNAGDTIGFTVEAENTGSGAATGVKLNDPLPAGSGSGVTWAIDTTVGTPTQFVLSGAAGSQTLSLASGTLPAGADYKVHITARTSQTECSSYDNKATLTIGNGTSPGPASAEESCALHVDLSITKAGSPARQEGLGNITWTMVVTNNGPDDDTGVKISDPIPAGNTFVSASSTQGTCTGGAILNCDIGPMTAGQKVTVTLVTTPSAAGTITNTVVVMGDRTETTLANNTASASVVVVAPHVIFCVAVGRISPGHLLVGRKTMLTIHLTRHGKAVKGIRVRIKGPKLNVRTTASNRKGVIKRVVKVTRKGILTVTPLTGASCNKRIGVRGVFTPPVTG